MQTNPPSDARIRLLAPLGHGGMSDVWLGALRGPAGFEKLVAVKQLRFVPSHAYDGGSAFLREARLAALLNHPNIVHTFEVVAQGGDYRIVMEFVEGQPLNRILKRAEGSLPLEELVRVIVDTLAGLHHAHELADRTGNPLNVVHRDVSPHNVFVSWEGAVKLLDFGIAAFGRGDVSSEKGLVMGKLAYMAPEQASGQQVDRRADVFAVGAILWQVLAGHQMWAGVPDPLLYTELVGGRIPPIDPSAPEAPAELRRICRTALALDPDDRFPTAAAMQQALDDWLDSTGGRPNPRTLGERVSELFATDRERIRSIVAQGLATEEEGGLTDLYAPTPARPLERAKPSISTTSSQRRRSKSGWLVTVVGALVALGTGTVGVVLLFGAIVAGGWLWYEGARPMGEAGDGCPTSGRPEVELSGMIDLDASLSCAKDYRLNGIVRVQPGATLTIAAGTVLRGGAGTTLVVSQGARIVAEGTAEAPIVLTSSADPPQPGDWGGLVILGRAPTNQIGGRFKGLTVDGDLYGGELRDDDSGVLRYVRIEYAGTVLAPNNETNGLTFAGVGRGTVVDHIAVRDGADDCFEWFGGTVDASHLVCVNPGDDAFDIEYGYVGNLTNLVLLDRNPAAPERDGFEVDDDSTNFDLLPRTAPVVKDVTLCGPGPEGGYGLLVRRGAAGIYTNLWVDRFAAVLDVRDRGGLVVRNVTAAVPLGPNEDLPADDRTPRSDDDGGIDEAALIEGSTASVGCQLPPVGPIGGLAPGDRWDLGWVVWE